MFILGNIIPIVLTRHVFVCKLHFTTNLRHLYAHKEKSIKFSKLLTSRGFAQRRDLIKIQNINMLITT